MAGDLEAAGVAGRVGEQRVDVGGRVLALDSAIGSSLRPPARRFGDTAVAMKHTPHGYWLEEAGTVEPAAAAGRRARAPTCVVVGGGYTGMWAAWHAEGARARGAGRPARGGRALRPRAERPQRRLLQRDVALAAEHARALGRRGGAGGRPRRRGRGRRDRRLLRGARGSTPGSAAAATSRSRPPRPHDATWRGGRRLPRAGRGRRGAGARARARSPSAAPRRPSAAASSSPTRRRCSRPGWRSACASGCSRPGSRSSSPRRCRRLRRRPTGSRRAPPAAWCARERAVLAIGGAAKGRRGPLRGRLIGRLLPHRPHRAGPRAARGDRLDRRRVHHRQPRPGRLLPHHPGRPDRLRLGRRPDRDGRRPRRPRRARPPRWSTATTAHLGDFFPGLAGARITHAWGGPIDASPTHLPLVLPLRGGRAFAAAGYTGNGVGPSHMVGRTLASLALDRRDEPSRLAFVDPSPPRVPPEPFHWIGGEAIRRRDHAPRRRPSSPAAQPGWLSSARRRASPS